MTFSRSSRAVLALLGFFVVWQAAVIAFAVPAFLLPTPVAVLQRIWFLAVNANLQVHAATTIGQILGGFIIGGSIGIVTGALFTRWPRLERVSSPLVLTLQTAPKIAIAPLLLLWLGLGPGPKIVLVAIVVFFRSWLEPIRGSVTSTGAMSTWGRFFAWRPPRASGGSTFRLHPYPSWQVSA